MKLLDRLRSLFARLGRGADAERLAARALGALEDALAEGDAEPRLQRLRDALALAERLPGERGDTIVLEASLHLGERLRAAGRREEAVLHFERAVMRSFRVADPLGRHRRAGVLSRLGILDQESGEVVRARARYREALDLGRDTDSRQLLGMLTQAAFNLGLLQSESGEVDLAVSSWESALDLGARAGHPAGWDPAAVAAFNLGHLYSRRGDRDRATRMFRSVSRIAEPSGTPLGLMACAKAALALASLADQDGLLGAPEVARQYELAARHGRESGLPEGALAALQAVLGLGERLSAGGRHAEAVAHYRDALALAARCEPAQAARFDLLARLRLGQGLAEIGEREEAVVHLARVFELGRRMDEPALRELAGQAACNLHRALAALERWEEARELAEASVAFTRTLASGTGRALEAAATYAHAFQALHDGNRAEALAGLDDVVRIGLESQVEVGTRIAVDAQLLIGHLHRQEKRLEESVRAFKDALAMVRDSVTSGPSADLDAMAAMAHVNLGHALLGLERAFEARKAYEAALERGRASGLASGRAAAANAALNLGSLLAGEVSDARLRECFELARGLGRSSATPLGNECAAQAERALARLEGGPPED